MAQSFTYVPPKTGQMFFDVPLGTYLYKGIRGVPGSGKSVVCDWDMRFKADMQPPFWDEKTQRMVRWSRWLIARKTFPALKNTTLKTWLDWFPSVLTDVHESSPMKGVFEAPSFHQDGTVVRMELMFYATDADNYMEDMDSLEVSGAYFNEAAQIPFKKIHKAAERVGRFKPPGASAQGWKGLSFGVIMDTNTPVESSWWHDFEQVKKPDRMRWFIQPPALIRTKSQAGDVIYVRNDEENSRKYGTSGPCENVEHHNDGWDYYEKQLIGADEDYIKMRLLNQYGKSKDGLPIYPEWSDDIHAAKAELSVVPGLPRLIGMDFGRNPACVIGQMTRLGQMQILDEITAFNMSVPQFVNELLIPKLMNDYNWPHASVMCFGDPAGMNSGEMYDIGCIEFLNNRGIPCAKPENLKNNDFNVRRDAVGNLLRSNYKGTPSLIVSRSCKMLIAGFNGDYCYRKMRTADGSAKYSEQADKNEYSHVHDALQYLVVGATGGSVDYSKPVGREDYSGLVGGNGASNAMCV